MAFNLVHFIVSFNLLFFGCKTETPPPPPPAALPFAAKPLSTPLAPGIVDEASGMADSKANTAAFWVEEDSGNGTFIQLLGHNGALQKKMFISNARNRDWEELALAPGPNGLPHLYLADIGDNNEQYDNYSIYRFPEPLASTDTVFAPEKITFRYEDGAHDAEALLIDPTTKDIYLITKRGTASKVYKLAYPQSTTAVDTAKLVVTLPFTGGVAATLSASGTELLIKNYGKIFYWRRSVSETIEKTLQKAPVELGYVQEPQGEAICFKKDDSGFYTLSEKSFAPSVTLNFYARL